MAGCNDDIILRKDAVICDPNSGISLTDFIKKVIDEYGGGSTTPTTTPAPNVSLYVKDGNTSATAIQLSNELSPLEFAGSGNVVVSRSGNTITVSLFTAPAFTAQTISPTILQIGQTLSSITTTGTVSNSGNVAANSYLIYNVTSSTNEVTGQSSPNITRTLGSTITKTTIGNTQVYKLKATDTQGTVFESSPLTISWGEKIFYGTTSSNASGYLTSSTIKSGTASALKTSRNGSYSVTGSTSTYAWIAIPTAMGTPTITVGGFPWAQNPSYTVNVTNDQSLTVGYTVYIAANKPSGSITLTVS